MSENIIIEKRDAIASFMTMASVASSYKVETTKNIAEGWNSLRQMVKNTDNLDYLATILSLSTVFGTAELTQQSTQSLEQIFNQIDLMKEDLKKEGVVEASDSDIAIAFLVNSSVSHSKGMSSRKALINHYQEIKDTITINDNKDVLAVHLSGARLMDVSKHPVPPELIKETFDGIRAEVDKSLEPDKAQLLEQGFGDNLLAACALTSAYIEISPKVEKYKDILNTWDSLLKYTIDSSQTQIISAILFAGKIRDLDSMHLFQLGALDEQIAAIDKHIKMYV